MSGNANALENLLEIIFNCENFTPFGLFVDPDVYIIVIVEFIS